MQADHDPYAALRHGDFRRYLVGFVLAGIGGELLAVAIAWEVYHRTPDKATGQLLLGLTGLAQFLPVLLFALPAGQAADRYSRKLLLQTAQLTMALAALGLAAVSWWEGPIGLIFVLLVMVGCSRALSMPSRVALVPQLVPPEQIASAVTWNSSTWQVASAAGPALGGLVLAVGSTPAFTYLLTVLCSLTCVALLVPIRPRAVVRPAQVRSLASLLAGVRFVWRTELLLAAITLDLFAVLLGGATALLPVFAKDILHVGAIGYGWLRAAPALGALVMAMVLAHRPPHAPGGASALARRGGLWPGHHRLRNVAQLFAVVRHARADRGAGQHQRGGARHPRSTAHAGFHARPGVGGERHLHQFVEPARRIRVGADGVAVRDGRVGGRRRGRHHPGGFVRHAALAETAASGSTAPEEVLPAELGAPRRARRQRHSPLPRCKRR